MFVKGEVIIVEKRRVFSSTWHDGRIYDAEEFFSMNKNVPFMFIIDTNFAIMIREFIVNEKEFKKNYANMYNDFINSIDLIRNNYHRIVYQYSCEEASRSKITGNINLEKYKLMSKCFEKVFQIDVNPYPVSYTHEISVPINLTKIPLLKTNGLYKATSVINYVMLLKAFILKHFDGEKTNKEKVISFLDFMEKEAKIFSPVTQTFAVHYFGTDTNILKKVKKGNRFETVLNKLYAAAIDLTLPTIAAQLSEFTGFNEVPIFVSFDQGINTIFDSLLIDNLGRTPSGDIVPGYTQKIFYSSGWNDKEIIELTKYGQKLQKNTKRKGKRNKIELYKLAEKLEIELALAFTKI